MHLQPLLHWYLLGLTCVFNLGAGLTRLLLLGPNL